ncbi:unnamed protein product [Vitrella brassicaformis CCMP3155]|uniref:1,4-alpha-glucan branching enzyme n=2 Tax=Vitrella brassicaformis TaxID=1169539 RepID=A0A0G4G4K1_VITBC|nr:unnamed protein product [Vitrella brassicaformis CCMP3155]|eukprot:CEM23190.1 unnamed protein product [Vitrella brassicaformis CCMP3155]
MESVPETTHTATSVSVSEKGPRAGTGYKDDSPTSEYVDRPHTHGHAAIAQEGEGEDGRGERTKKPPLGGGSGVVTFEALNHVPSEISMQDDWIGLLHTGMCPDPYECLGCHPYKEEDGWTYYIIRAWIGHADRVRVRSLPSSSTCVMTNGPSGNSEPMELTKRADWLFEGTLRAKTPEGQEREAPDFEYEFLITYSGEPELPYRDPFSFKNLLMQKPEDLRKFASGSCWHVDDLMGSHYMDIDGSGLWGTRFSVWAPEARHVSVVGDWNGWDGRAHPLRKIAEYGVWEMFIPTALPGHKYKYRIITAGGGELFKVDLYAQEYENPPETASIISKCDDTYRPASEAFEWTDAEWMARRAELGRKGVVNQQPVSIYEVHLPSWMRGEDGRYLSYREIAPRLVSHLKAINFTHVEFMPLSHHPFEGSWGYQVTGQYAPYSRLGSADDLKHLINALHEAGIGVFLDLVPAHFCKDAWAVTWYDGSAAYEYSDPREGEHKEWGTGVFNFGRHEVRSFLLGAAYHWLRRYHVDGLRIDAVTSMIYKNHMRPAGQWLPNEYGGDSNLQAISLLQEMNWVVHEEWPGVVMMAEESTAWENVTRKEGNPGLGFDYKWDLGWMNDTLKYLTTPYNERPGQHNKLTFRGLYYRHEKWILPLSHDEVVSGKGSLLDKCACFGTAPYEDRIKTLRALYGYQVGQPGRPLLFMGGEIAMGREWRESKSVDWHEGEEDLRSKCCIWVSDLMGTYRTQPALHAGDDDGECFQWVDCDNASAMTVAFLRKWQYWWNDVLVICNFSGWTHGGYRLGVPHGGEWEVLLNSDDWKYGGTMKGPGNQAKVHADVGGVWGWHASIALDIPAYSCLVLLAPQPSDEDKERHIKERHDKEQQDQDQQQQQGQGQGEGEGQQKG